MIGKKKYEGVQTSTVSLKTLLEMIEEWVIANHQHHEGGETYALKIDANVSPKKKGRSPVIKHIKATGKCVDVSCPYVNSMRLVDYLHSLIK